MALAVDVIDRRRPSNKMHRQLQPKKTYITHLYSSKRVLLTLQTKHFSFKDGCVVRVENGQNASPVTAKEDKSKATLAIYIRSRKGHLSRPSLLKRLSPLVLKVGASYRW